MPNDGLGAPGPKALGAPTEVLSEPKLSRVERLVRRLGGGDAFRDRYVRAREALMDFYAEQILVIAFDESGDIVVDQAPDGRSKTVANHAKVQRDRLKVDSLKWIASRLFPKRYV